MKAIIEKNRALLKRARELNNRAGREVFSVPTKGQLTEVLQSLLGNVARLADIRSTETFQMPVLDDHLVAQVLAESPDTITVFGHEVVVEYRSGYTPRVKLNFQGNQAREWLQLPDDGIHLPGGREVEMVSVVEGYFYNIEASSSKFKAKARECLNQGLWDKWQKPELPAPTESIPPVMEKEYGRCVVTDVPLVAYGTVKYDSYYGSWKSYWSRDPAEAERVHAQACAKFVEVNEKVARDALRKRVGDLNGTHYNNSDLPHELRTRMYNTYYGYSGDATTAAELEALINELEAVLAEAEAKKAAEAARITAAEASGYLIRELKITCDTRYNRGHVWVIRPDGSLRTHDTTAYTSRARYTCYVWHLVSDEVVLVEGVTSVEGVNLDFYGTGVVWRPLAVTADQIAAVTKVEEEHQLGGTFVIDPAQTAYQAQLLEEICTAVAEISPQEYLGEVSYKDFANGDGCRLQAVNAKQWMSRNREYTHRCEGRDAQLVHSVRCAGGILEFLVYHKWGVWNMNARLRAMTEDEERSAPVETAPAAPPDEGVVSTASLQALAAKFAKR